MPSRKDDCHLACLFSLKSSVALSRTVVGTTLIQPSQTQTTHDINTRVKLAIVTILYINECLEKVNLSLYVVLCDKMVIDLDLETKEKAYRNQKYETDVALPRSLYGTVSMCGQQSSGSKITSIWRLVQQQHTEEAPACRAFS